MALKKLNEALYKNLEDLRASGRDKGEELVIKKIKKAEGEFGPRYLLEGYDEKEFIKMNANSYLGMSMNPDVIEAEEAAAQEFGVGPGAVRFISGTHTPHIALEKKLAKFHGREAGMIFSSAYVTSLGVIFPLTTKETVVVSDELNHNCIIQAMRLSRPAAKLIYKHNDMADLEAKMKEAVGKGKRCIVVTDGIFSMRGDFAPFDELTKICAEFDDKFDEGVITIADDSHGVGAFGKTGRGTEEYTGAKVDILIGTLGKAFGVNGGYVVASDTVIEYLREQAPMYIYSNPITCSEAAATLKVLEMIDSDWGVKRLEHLSAMTKKFEDGLKALGFETIEGPHPVVPLMVRDTAETTKLVKYLTKNGVLGTGLNFPVVPKGDEEIRFQVNADHTEADIDKVLEILANYKK
ncbi:MAG: aminotransferase class I/II-fold pyridoxal phosphate-dependent enzyme [Candidatus Cloacimonetes bacterium]|nr:aminotransferase class I/II-fold pyridoxal phosphate-dependent enzyme [Candidatus Cloacimonadota bacterium]MCF7812860.1 aminotransferase class I/II-fold pyridoxal phosphate-dependent enzyme [Candidatus Cloacimonadota bacterium]MCF7867072.1 aminotransferase class I/II-fold pyridoxal phosphate-dependent enzyme [Candidatus Cloacimonadota bacterium]MCF7882608.1 aminotransferase class I/II-fold pyridoxal phosphate-dependent enzyme [Candidatus Cloacimonadota bacterium]